jgi:hypothetical protein
MHGPASNQGGISRKPGECAAPNSFICDSMCAYTHSRTEALMQSIRQWYNIDFERSKLFLPYHWVVAGNTSQWGVHMLQCLRSCQPGSSAGCCCLLQHWLLLQRVIAASIYSCCYCVLKHGRRPKQRICHPPTHTPRCIIKIFAPHPQPWHCVNNKRHTA